jgi:BON domain
MTWRFQTRTSRGPAARWWISAAGVAGAAAAAAYWLDPDRGNARRRRAADRTVHAARRVWRGTRREIRYLTLSTANRLRHRIVDGPPVAAEGRMLLDRVESELFTDARVPHGRLSLEVEGMTVILRGELDSNTEIDYVEQAVRRIPGVYDVRDLLHVTGTEAPNKVDALNASSGVAAEQWPDEPPPDVDSEEPMAASAATAG